MGLRDRFTLRALIAVAVQGVAAVAVLAYGFSLLGAKMTAPSLLVLGAYGALAWLTLRYPWDWTGLEPRQPLGRIWGYFEPGVVYGMTVGLAYYVLRAVIWPAKAKGERVAEELSDALGRALASESTVAWAEDTYGRLLVTPLDIVAVLLFLGLTWFLMPR